MIYQQLMYSRSKTKDYRWMIAPSSILSENNLTILVRLYSHWRDASYKRNIFKEFPVLAGIRFEDTSTYCVVTFAETQHRDIHARPIHSLYGICIDTTFPEGHQGVIMEFIRNPQQADPWHNIDYTGADTLQRGVMELESEESINQDSHTWNKDRTTSYKPHIAYTESGYNSLIATLEHAGDEVFKTNFVFGGAPIMDIDEQHFNFDIFVPLYNYQKIACNIDIREQKSWRSFALKTFYIYAHRSGDNTTKLHEEKFTIPFNEVSKSKQELLEHPKAKEARSVVVAKLLKEGWYETKELYKLQKLGR